jgi:enoyl-CoA hydratase
MNDPVSYSLEGTIATVTMDDGKVNALSIATLTALHEALDQAERDGAVVLLSGRDGYLSAGFDLKVFAAGGDEVLEMLRLGATLYERMLSHPTPVVLACTGHAVAAGAFLTLAADARIGANGPFQIGMNEVRIGLTMPWFAIELARHRLHRPTTTERSSAPPCTHPARPSSPASSIASSHPRRCSRAPERWPVDLPS